MAGRFPASASDGTEGGRTPAKPIRGCGPTALGPEVYGDSATRVLLAVQSQQRPTVRSVAAAVGLGISATHYQLRALRADLLVDWSDGDAGTLHALVWRAA